MLPIHQNINALCHLNRTAKAVLIEVCELVENGGQGCCTARNEYLVLRLGGTERTISRAITELEKRGLLHIRGLGKARRLFPTPPLRACYTGPDATARQAAAVALNLAVLDEHSYRDATSSEHSNLDKTGCEPRRSVQVGEVPNLDKSGSEPRQNRLVNLDKTGHQPRQNGSRVIGDDQYEQVTTSNEHTPWVNERAEFEKRIAELEFDKTRLEAKILELTPIVAVTPQTRDASSANKRISGASKNSITDLGPSFDAFWQVYDKKVDTKKCRRSWQALSPEQQRAAMAHVPKYVAATPDVKFRKNPRSYLNGECWLDEANLESLKPRALGPTGGPPPIATPFAIADKVRQQQQNTYL